MNEQKRRSRQATGWLAAAYFIAMAVAVTFPGVVPFNTIRPFILGVPFVFMWYMAWTLGALVVFLILHRTFGK